MCNETVDSLSDDIGLAKAITQSISTIAQKGIEDSDGNDIANLFYGIVCLADKLDDDLFAFHERALKLEQTMQSAANALKCEVAAV